MKKKNVLALALAAGLVFGSQANAQGPKIVDFGIDNGDGKGQQPAVTEKMPKKEAPATVEEHITNKDPLTKAEAPFGKDGEINKPNYTSAEAPFAGKEKTNGFNDAEAPFQKRDDDVKLNKAEDPFGSTKVKKAAPTTAYENVKHSFKTVQEAIAAYPDSKPMFENGKYVVYSDKAPLVGYQFDSAEKAAEVFPNLKVEAKNGKYYVYTAQAPLLKYTFNTQAEAFEAFQDIKPMFENGKYVIYTQEAPKVTYEFASYKDAIKAFPGSNPEARDGKYYVHTRMEPVEGTVAKKVVGNPDKLVKVNPETGEIIGEEAKKPADKKEDKKADKKAVSANKTERKANKASNVNTGVAGLTGVVATLAAASTALFKSKRK